jgi:DNA-binding SARP family transcriptional activator/tetratricopeptide (TPR) repeat protein
VSVLGGQQITDDRDSGRPVRSSRGLALVAYLAVDAGVPHARQRIAGLLWPESGDAQALTNLRRELHHLRQALGDDGSLLVTARDLCWVDAPTCQVDVRVFDTERLAALAAAAAGDDEAAGEHGGNAIAQYRGELLPGVYDDLLAEPRARLERQCVELCDLVSAARARAGDLAGAVAAARRRIELQPLEEVGYRVLMGLQADMGDRAAAVSTYRHCASVLKRELSVVPDDATRAAVKRLLTQPRAGPPGAPGLSPPSAPEPPNGPSPASGPGPPTSASGPRAAGGGPGQPDAPLIGRSADLRALADAWQAAAAGRHGMVLVAGSPGVGKTRLVAEVGDLARQQGAIVVGTQCFAAPGRLALAPVADWLRDPAVQAAAATLDPAWRAEVARLVPDQSVAGHNPGPGAMADAWQQHRFFEGLARALLAVRRPLLLVLDNVQWCDRETLDFITFCLCLAHGGTRLLVAGTVRDDHRRGDRDLGAWAVRMQAAGLLTEFSLSPLDAADTARLAQAISGRPIGAQDTATLHATTGGFPLYVIEATRGDAGHPARSGRPGDSGGPGGPGGVLPPGDLSAVLRNRLAQATPAAQEVAGLAAAVGTNFSLDLLTEASELPSDVVVAAVDELWRNRVLREFGPGYDFSHDLLRDAAYAEVTPARRWLLHRRVAQALELLGAGDTDAVAPQLAAQYARAGDQAKAVAYYRHAAQVAAGRFAHAEAIRLCREALSVIKAMPEGRDRDGLELSVLNALAAPLNAREGYASPDLERGLRRSVALAESLDRDDLVQAGLVALATTWFVQGRTADSHQVAARALGLAAPGSSAAGQALFILGGTAIHLGRPGEGLRHLAAAADLDGGGTVRLSVGTRVNVHATAWGAHAHWLLGDDETAVGAAREAVGLARRIGDPYSLAVALAYSAVTDQMRHDRPGLRAFVDELRDLCRRYKFAYYREWALILDGWSRDERDSDGIRLAELGIANLYAQGAFARRPYWLSLLADRQAGAGRTAEASATLDAALAAGHVHGDVWWLPEVMRMRAAYDPPGQDLARLRAAADLATSHGSVALACRCEHDLHARGLAAAGAAQRGARR